MVVVALSLAVLAGLAASPLPADHQGPGKAYLVADLIPGPEWTVIADLFPLRDLVLFFHVDYEVTNTGIEYAITLLRSDGTAEGTYSLMPSGYRWFAGIEVGETHYFFALCSEEPRYGRCPADKASIWSTDGTRKGTVRILAGGTTPGDTFWYGATGDPLLGTGRFVLIISRWIDGVGVRQLWTSDGTPAGTRFVETLENWFEVGPLYPVEGHVFGRRGVDRPSRFGRTAGRLIRTDGTAGGTVQVSEGELDVVDLWTADGAVWFFARESLESNLTLWTVASPRAAPKRLGELDIDDVYQRTFVRSDGQGRLFLGVNGSGNHRLWVTDGTVAGTRQILPSEHVPDFTGGSTVFPFPAIGDLVPFAFNSPVVGRELWVTDGTSEGTRLVADLCPGECYSTPGVYGTSGGSLVFSANQGDGSGRHVWLWTPGEEPRLHKRFCAGACDNDIRLAMTPPGRILLAASPKGEPGQLWMADPRSESGLTIEAPGRVSFFDDQFFPLTWTAAGGRVFFPMNDGLHGQELWAIPLPGAGTTSDPPPPDAGRLTSPALPGYAVWVRIHGAGSEIVGRAEPKCITETLCVSGAVSGRSELFVRIVGPKPNGFLWPTLVKFTTSRVEVWIEHLATGEIRHYELEGASPGSSELPGLFDRAGFEPE